MIAELFIVCFFCTSVMCKEKAILEIVMHTSTKNGEYDTKIEELIGHFTTAGPMESAEGNVLQVHPMSICSNDNPERRYKYGWVGVIKLGLNEPACMTLYQKAKKAIQRGATAVVFDITNNPKAAKQLKNSLEVQLERPVIVIRGHEAEKLMRIVRSQKNARARIRSLETKAVENKDVNTKEYFDMGIFVAVFILFCIICIIVIIKLKWRHREQQLSMAEMTKRAIAKLETRKYNVVSTKTTHTKIPVSEIYSSSSSGEETCAICLEDYRESEILRVLPCSHEFHKACVDQWLVTNRTCPLCLFNIVDQNEPIEDQEANIQQRSNVIERPRGQGHSYDIPQNDNYNRQININNTHQQMPTYSQSVHLTRNYSQGQSVHHGCPSCQGTMGSSPSSGSSYLREFRPITSGRKNLYSLDHTYHNVGCNQILHRTCCHSDREQQLFHQYHPSYHRTVYNSGISYSHHYSSHNHHIHSNHQCYTDSGVFPQTSRCKGPLGGTQGTYVSGKMWESDPECVESVKNSSITANYGSCSSCSNGNPSYSSLDCDCCQHLSTRRTNVIDSTHSTYGSSDNKDKTDVSSCDSNVFWGGASDQICGGAPDQMCTEGSSESRTSSPESYVVTTAACDCEHCAGEVIHKGNCNCNKNVNILIPAGSDSSLNLSDLSGCDTVENSQEFVCDTCDMCNSCSSGLSALSEISNNSTFYSDCSLSVDTSHTIAKQHCLTLPKIKSASLNEMDSKSTQCTCKHNILDFKTNQRYSLEDDTSGNTLKNKNICHCDCYSLSRDSNFRNNFLPCKRVSSSWSLPLVGMSSDFDINSYQHLMCERCRHGNRQLPHQSMVMFAESQGAFVTIPLKDKEKYDPVNAV